MPDATARSPSQRARFGSRRRHKVALALGAALFGLALAEGILQISKDSATYDGLYAMHGKPYVAATSNYLPFTLEPGIVFPHQRDEFEVVYTINALGYRGLAPGTLARPEGVKRLIVCGDSFTLGWGNDVEDTFVARLQQRLATSGYEVINAGYHAGYTPDAYYAYLRREGQQLDPAAVLLVLYTGNDVLEMRDTRWLETDATGAPIALATNWLYLDYAGRLIHPRGSLDASLPWNYHIPVLRQTRLFMRAANAANTLAGTGVSVTRVPGEISEEQAWERLDTSLRATRAWADERKVALAVALISPDPSRDLDRERDARFAATVRAAGIELRDLALELTPEDFYAVDGHLKPAGNQRIVAPLLELLGRVDGVATRGAR